MPVYSEKVMDHFTNPRNVGELENPDGVGTVGNPVCGDLMTFQIKAEGDRIADVKFKTFGCGAAIAVSSMVSEMAIGKTLDEAMKISNKDVASELGGLPSQKMHCSNLGADALHAAIENYRERQAEAHKTESVACPFCDDEMAESCPVCTSCGANLRTCPSCGQVVEKYARVCSHCNAPLEPVKEQDSGVR